MWPEWDLGYLREGLGAAAPDGAPGTPEGAGGATVMHGDRQSL